MGRMQTLILVSLLGGCGWKAKYEDLQGELADQVAALAARDAELANGASTIAHLEGLVVEQAARIDDLKSDLAAMEADLDTERDRNARMLADRGALRDQVTEMKEALKDLEKRRRQAEERVAAYRDLVSRFQAMIDAGKLDVRIVDGRMVVVLATDILFSSGSADLSDGGASALSEVAAVLAGIPDRRYQVEGHTDNVPINTAKYPSNWYLAAARAIHVVNHLTDNGLTPDRISAASYADTRPVASNDDKDARALNRRIEIVVVPDLADLPGYDELNAAGAD